MAPLKTGSVSPLHDPPESQSPPLFCKVQHINVKVDTEFSIPCEQKSFLNMNILLRNK